MSNKHNYFQHLSFYKVKKQILYNFPRALLEISKAIFSSKDIFKI